MSCLPPVLAAADGLTWARPWLWPVGLLLPTVWLLVFALLRARVRARARYGATFTERMPGPAARATLLTAIAALLWLCWMEPRLGEERVPVERRGLDVVFCLDTSRSMLARDLEPNRLERAKRDIRSLLPALLGGDRVALIAFAGETRLVVPPTHDLDSFARLLDRVDTDTVRVGGTDLAAALRRALELAEEGEERTTAIVLLTDGEDLAGAGRQAALEVRERGVVLHAVGYGSTRGSKILVEEGGEEAFLRSDTGDEVVSTLDADSLRAMAEAAGGDLVRADVVALPLLELKRKRLDPMLQRTFEAGEETVAKTRYQWVLIPCFVLLLVELFLAGGRAR
ncbi:MAG TPA: VWA domain-containing protein [Planctomycetota bacterium]|nr:VWA domain-containing protein [Planctomycetota bacterium]